MQFIKKPEQIDLARFDEKKKNGPLETKYDQPG